MASKKSTNVQFAEELVQLMNERRLDNASLARAVSITPTAIGNYRAGRLPKAEELLRLADFFEVSTDQLARGRKWIAMRDEFQEADQFAARVAESGDDERIKTALFNLKLERDGLRETNRSIAKQLSKIAEQLQAVADRLDPQWPEKTPPAPPNPIKYDTKPKTKK